VRAGSGGRSTECLLGLRLALAGEPAFGHCAPTPDGIDGKSDAAGAVAGRTRWPAPAPRARPAGGAGRPRQLRAVRRLGDLVRTGPTLTNVNDFRAVLVR
jgi:hydroxypyruvate reductase